MGLAEKQGQTVESAAATPVDIDSTGKHKRETRVKRGFAIGCRNVRMNGLTPDWIDRKADNQQPQVS